MNLKEFLLDTLFPPRCLTCAVPLDAITKKHALCAPCLAAIPVSETLFCIDCRARLADDIRICHAKTPLRLAAVGRYSDPKLRALITRMKYRRHTTAINALIPLIDRYLPKLGFSFTGYHVVALPLHPKRERQRGFNQSLLIAEIIARKLNLPLIQGELIKTRSTLPQAKTKNRRERISNLSNCFTVRSPLAFNGKKVLLVDDVCTSGSTLREAANTLRRAGAKNIIGFVMAKTD